MLDSIKQVFINLSRPLAALALLAALLGLVSPAGAQPQTGPVDADFAPIDTLMRQYLAARKFPGATVVIGYGDRIIYAQSYGYADVARAIPLSPWQESRLGSVSKPLTAAAVMRLVEQGRVGLDAPAWNYISSVLGTTQPADARLKQVTVRQLLTHTWGLNRAVSPDPVGLWYPDGQGGFVVGARDMLRYHLQRMTLNFAPGARYAYNNTGFVWLQQIAEAVDGRPIEAQLTAMLGPEALSPGRIRFGLVPPSQLTPAEPRYYDYVGARLYAPVPGLYPAPAPAQVAGPDGAFTNVGYGGSGGFVASPLTVVRFIQRLSGQRQPSLLNAATRRLMFTEQTLADGTRYEGLGLSSYNPYTPDDYALNFSGGQIGARNAGTSTPREPRGPMLTVFVQSNGTPVGQGSEVVDNPSTEILTPLVFAVDGIANYRSKPEISTDRLIAWASPTQDHYADMLFDWAQRAFPALFPGAAQAGVFEGYRYRYYPSTQTYLGIRDGQIYLYQPAQSPVIQPIASMATYLPQAQAELGR